MVIVPIYGLGIAGTEIKAPIIRPITAKKKTAPIQRCMSSLSQNLDFADLLCHSQGRTLTTPIPEYQGKKEGSRFGLPLFVLF